MISQRRDSAGPAGELPAKKKSPSARLLATLAMTAAYLIARARPNQQPAGQRYYDTTPPKAPQKGAPLALLVGFWLFRGLAQVPRQPS